MLFSFAARTSKGKLDRPSRLICLAVVLTRRVRFRVSSTVLSLGSSVFKALLSPHFREGSQLASAPEVEIPLPEDDAGALATVIEVMHMTATTTTPKPSPEELLAIAIVADKYDCLAAVTYATHVWISRRSMDVEGADISTLFIAAALLEHDDLFASIGKTLILDSQGEIKKVIVESGIAWHAVFGEWSCSTTSSPSADTFDR